MRKTLRIVEATIGAFFTFALGFALLLASLVLGYALWHGPGRWLVLPLAIPVCLELRFLYVLKVKLEEGHYPFAPYFAMQYRRWPLVLRPVVAIWWLAHFAAGIAAIILADNILVMNMTDWNTRVLRSVLFVAVSFTIAYSANLFLLLTVTAIGGGRPAVSLFWRYRFLLDLAVAVIAAFFPIISRLDRAQDQKPAIPPDITPHHLTRAAPATTGSAE